MLIYYKDIEAAKSALANRGHHSEEYTDYIEYKDDEIGIHWSGRVAIPLDFIKAAREYEQSSCLD